MENVVISNPPEFERKKALLKAGGAENLHVVADYDKTLSTAHVKGNPRRSLVEIIRQFDYLSPAFSKGSYALFNKYHPIEMDPSIPLEEKKFKMLEWWSVHVKWMAECGMSQNVINRIVDEQPAGLRKGLDSFLTLLHKNKVPVLILSAALTDLIEGFLQKEGILFPNVHVVSNKYEFDEKGNVIGYESVIIHSFNKNEIAIRNTPYFSQIKNRKNVLLLGDAVEDVGMVEGIEHDCVLKIGFLNEKVDEKREKYTQVYDVVITNDGPLDFVNALLREILE
jgi:5'-nucleotidase